MSYLLKRFYGVKPPVGFTYLDFTNPIVHGMVACWVFNENSGGIVNLVNGEVSNIGIGTSWVSTPEGLSLDFTTSNVGIQTTDLRALFTNRASCYAVVELDAVIAFPMIFATTNLFGESNGGMQLRGDVSNGYPTFAIDETSGRPSAFVSTSMVGLGLVHIAGVYNGASIITYLDGIASAPTAANGNLSFGATGAWRIGNTYDGSAPWDGRISFLGVWNRDLQIDEVQTLKTLSPYSLLKQVYSLADIIPTVPSGVIGGGGLTNKIGITI